MYGKSAMEIASKEIADLIAAAKSPMSAIEELAGEGRTTETVKGNADAIAAHKAETAHIVYVSRFGATGDSNTDDSSAIQSAIDFVRKSYNPELGNFEYILDFGGQTFRIEKSLDFTSIRQPGFRLQNGGVYAACTGKIALDFGGTNNAFIENFTVYGDKTNTPSVGIYYGREEIDGTAPIAPSIRLVNVQTNGYFEKAAIINFASEVSAHYGCRFINRSRSLTAYTYINCGHGKSLLDYVGEVKSDYITIPTPGLGAISNILHYESQSEYLRASDVVLTILSISKSNPAVVSVDSSALLLSNLADGDKVFFHEIIGMTELNYNVYEVANMNMTAGTFELVGVDSTGYGTFISGRVWNQTGPAVLFNGNHRTYWESNYILTYGNDPIQIDLDNGTSPRDNVLGFHAEAHPKRIINMFRDQSTTIIQRFTINLLNSSQTIKDEFIKHTGTGGVRIDDLNLNIANMGTAPVNKLFNPAERFTLRNANIYTPLASSLNVILEFNGFSGVIVTADDNKRYQYGIAELYDISLLDFQTNGTALTQPGMRYTGSSYIVYNNDAGAERQIRLSDIATTSQLNSVADRINTRDKYAGKIVWNVSLSRPVYATGGSNTSTWVFADGTTAHTPV